MTVSVVLLGLGTVAFGAVAVLAVRDWLRRRTHAKAALAAALVLLATVSAASVVRDLVGDGSTLLVVTLLGFAGSGYAVLEYGAGLFGLDNRWRALAAGGLALPTIVLATGPLQAGVLALPLVLVLVGTWVACVVGTAVRLWASTSEAAPVQRAQLRTLGAIFSVLAVLVLVRVAMAYVPDPPTSVSVALGVVTGLAAIVLYVAVRAPRWLRRPWVSKRTDEMIERLTPVGTWHYDVATSESWWSPAMREILGLSTDHPPGIRRYLEIVHPDDRDHLAAQLERTLTEAHRLDDVYRIVRPADGEVRWIRGVGDVFRDVEQQEVSAVFGTIADITPHKEAEEHLVAALGREQAATDELRRLDEMKDTFLAAVSHELRTPLTTLKGFASMLHEHPERLDEERRADVYRRMAENASRLERMLTDLLDLERLGRDGVEPRAERVNVSRVIRSVLDGYELDDRVVHIDLPGDGVILLADAAHIERIVDNLVRNAITHTPSGTTLWIEVNTDPRRVEIIVADDGPGVPDELKTEIFQRFRHGTPSPTRGAGVGLSLVAQFALLQGGRAWVTDRPGGGAAFHVELPVRSAAARDDASQVC